MENNKLGNRITDNALGADNGKDLIDKGLNFINDKFSWRAVEEKILFRGVYYDSQKVGSHIIKVVNDHGEKAVLKLQLRPLPFDEGFIIRHINQSNRSIKIRTLKILNDLPWNKELGFGFLIFEDVSDLNNLWKANVTDENDRHLHKQFLKEFLNDTLPVKSWLELPKHDLKGVYKDTFEHFQEIAERSAHRHIDLSAVEVYKDSYFKIIDNFKFEEVHFTHGHLSGLDIKYYQKNDMFVLMANLYWSYRPQFHELTFPMWVDIMHLRNKNLIFAEVLERINAWGSEWKNEIYDFNPLERRQYWFNLLERAIMTIMLDLGASEWLSDEIAEKQSLLEAWQELFNWIIKEKFTN